MASSRLFGILALLLMSYSSFCYPEGSVIFEKVQGDELIPNPDSDEPFPPTHEIIPRTIIRFRSKGPNKDDEYEYGLGFKGHVVNLLKGGTVGVDFRIPTYSFPKDSHDSKDNDDKVSNIESEDKEWNKVDREGRNMDYGDLIDPRTRRI